MEIIEDEGIIIENITESKYRKCYFFRYNLARVETEKMKYGFIDKYGVEKIYCQYDDAYDFSEELAAVKRNGKWGFIDTKGKETIPLIYDEVYSFSEGLAAVKKNGLWYFIDKTGDVKISLAEHSKIDNIWSFCYGIAMFRTNHINRKGYVGIIEHNGTINIVSGEYSPIRVEGNDIIKAELAYGQCDYHRYGYIDKTGKEIIPFIYDRSSCFCEELVCMRRAEDSKWGFYDWNGNEVIPFIYDDADNFSEGVAYVYKEVHYEVVCFGENVKGKSKHNGLIDKENNLVIPFRDKPIPFFYNGFVSVGNCYIDKTGEKKICLRDYEELQGEKITLHPFEHGLAKIEIGVMDHMVINTNGYVIVPRKGRQQIEIDSFDGTILCIKHNYSSKYKDFEYITVGGGRIDLSNRKVSLSSMNAVESIKKFAPLFRGPYFKYSEYYDLIVEGVVYSFETKEEREEFKNSLVGGKGQKVNSLY